jgi:energy-coupling factor transporter transmembrane protein EcfT
LARRILDAVPGTPSVTDSRTPTASFRPRHPAALLGFTLLVAAGITLTRAPAVLALAAALFAIAALRAEGRRLRGELPLLGLAAVLFLAHALLARFEPAAVTAAALLALRLLALVYLTRWAVRAFLPAAARWLLSLPMPPRPRALALAAASARLSASLLPLAAREAEAQTLALRARGIRPGGGVAGRARFVAAWLLPFLGTMLRVGDALADALHARGYAAGAPRGTARFRWSPLDAAVLAGGLLAAGALLRGF